jgi:hypothetical protein
MASVLDAAEGKLYTPAALSPRKEPCTVMKHLRGLDTFTVNTSDLSATRFGGRKGF